MSKRLGLRSAAGHNRKRGLALGGIGVLAALVAVVALVGSGSALASGTGCPSLSGKATSPDISATFVDNGDGTATYSVNGSALAGSLIKLCVYTSPSPDTATPALATWGAAIDSSAFAFSRNTGNDNIAFDGNSHDVGTAAWTTAPGTVPTNQVILLHISSSECGPSSQTCFVLPSNSCVDNVDCGGGTASATDVETELHLEAPAGGDSDPVTVVAPSGHVDLGSTLHDLATVTADDLTIPEGTVYFGFYDNIDCSLDGADAGSAAVDNAGVAHPSSSEGPLAAGDHSFQALFVSSDLTKWTNNISPCEPFTVDQGSSNTATAIHLGATDGVTAIVVTSITVGQTVHDSATVTGTPAAFTPTGTVDFTWFPNGLCTEGTGTAAGTGVQLVNGVADPSSAETPIASGTYAFQATYSGDGNYTGSTSPCEPLIVYKAPLTPGYWKTHLAPLSPTCSSKQNCSANGPWTSLYLPQSLGSYVVNTTVKVTAVFNLMNCSNTGSNSAQNQNAIGCLAGHLLAAKLNVANGSDPCINTTIATADAFLILIGYTGPTGNYSALSAANRATAIALKNTLDKYNNGGGC